MCDNLADHMVGNVYVKFRCGARKLWWWWKGGGGGCPRTSPSWGTPGVGFDEGRHLAVPQCRDQPGLRRGRHMLAQPWGVESAARAFGAFVPAALQPVAMPTACPGVANIGFRLLLPAGTKMRLRVRCRACRAATTQVGFHALHPTLLRPPRLPATGRHALCAALGRLPCWLSTASFDL